MNHLAAVRLLVLGAVMAPASGQAPAPAPAMVQLQAQLVDVAGRPIAGVGVIVGEIDGLTTAAAVARPVARSDAQGGLVATVLPRPLGSAYVRVTRFALFAKPGYTTVRVPAMQNPYYTPWGVRAAPRRDLGRIVMYPAAVITGVVRGARGRPLVGARVVATELAFAGSQARFANPNNRIPVCTSAASTDARGRFALAGVVVEGLALTVTAPGHYRHSEPYDVPGRRIDISLQPCGVVRGRVLDGEGKPVSAHLYLQMEGDANQQAAQYSTPQTATDGSFELSLFARGRYRVRAQLIIKPGQTYRTVSSEIYSAPRHDLLLELVAKEEGKPPIIVTAVAKTGGRSVADARAMVLWQDPRYVNAMIMESAFGAAVAMRSGRVELSAPVGRQSSKGTLLVKAKGFAPQLVEGIEYDAEDPPVVEVKLVPGAVVAGVVVDEVSAAPLVDALVTLRHAGTRVVNPYFGRVPQPSAGITARTDAAGRFRIEDLPAGRFELTAESAGRPTSKLLRLKLAESEQRGDLRVPASRGVCLSGKLFMGYGDAGKPRPVDFAGVAYQVRLAVGHSTGSSVNSSVVIGLGSLASRRATVGAGLRVAVGPAGGFEFRGLGAGRYRLSLVAPPLGRRGRALEVAIEPVRVRRKPMQRDFDISADLGGVLRGKLRMTGAPLATSRLMVLAQPARTDRVRSRNVTFSPAFLRCLVEADGSFAFRVARGKHLLWVMDGVAGTVLYRHADLVEVQPGVERQLDLELPLARVRVRLVAEDRRAGFVASTLSCLVEHPGQAVSQNFYRYNRGGLAVEGRTEFLLHLPPISAQFAVRSNLSLVDPKGGHNNQAIGEAEFKPVIGKLNTLDIKLSPPSDVSDAGRK